MDDAVASTPLGHGRARLVRALLVALVTVGVSVGAHTLCGGTAPGPAALAALLAASAGATWTVSGRQWTTARLAVLMTAVEVATHLAGRTSHPAMPPMAHGATAGMPGMPGMSGWSMLLAHVAAGALSVAYLRSGERALWRLVATWAVRLLAVAGAPAAPPTLPHSPVLGLTRRPVLRLAVVRVGSRAPPVSFV